MASLSQKHHTSLVEITITISTAILINYDKRHTYIHAIFYINCHHDFNLGGIFEKMTSLTQILGTRKINGGRKFSEIKIKKVSSNVRKRLKLGKIFKEDCVRKCKKMNVENLIIVAL